MNGRGSQCRVTPEMIKMLVIVVRIIRKFFISFFLLFFFFIPKAIPGDVGFYRKLLLQIAVPLSYCRCSQSNWCRLSRSQVKWEVVSVTLVHYLESKVLSVYYVSPCRNNFTISIYYWLVKVKPLRLKAIVQIPMEVSHMPTTGKAPRKKCRERELLKEAYWNISLPKYPWAATML